MTPWRTSAPLAFLVVLTSLAGLGCTQGNERPGRDGGVGGPDAAPIMRRCDSTTDADSDGLYDDFEGGPTIDTDRDGTPDFQDTDSDNDGIDDAVESGALGGCLARNSDDDPLPDYVDNDADNDGLSDREETETYSTDPTSSDTDGDTFDDLAEVATGHDPNDATSVIPSDDFYVVLPYLGPAQQRPLRFRTRVQRADVFFMMDRTGSMTDEVDTLKSSLSTIVDGMVEAIPDIGVGFGGFSGFGGPASGAGMCVLGICTYQDGPDGDVPFNLYSVITTDRDQMQRDAMMLEADQGGATWASHNEALYQAATGEGILPWVRRQSCPAIPDEMGRRYGYPCFRPGSLPIMVVMTDTSSKNGPHTEGVSGGTYDASGFTMGPPPHTYPQTLASLQGIGARVIGVMSISGGGDCSPQVSNPTCDRQFDTWARETGTVDATGNPITFEIGCDGSGLGTGLVDAIRTLTSETPQDISATSRDGADFAPADVGPIDATMFIKAITPIALYEDGTTMISCPDATRCDDTIFRSVSPGDSVEFDVRFQNDFVPSRTTSQVFRATILVLGNGVAELDSREVAIVVPAGSDPFLI